MSELRKFLGAVFGFIAFSCAWTAISLFFRALHTSRPRVALHVSSGSLFSLAFLISCVSLYGAACWAVLLNRKSGRILGLVASITPFLGMALLVGLSLIYHSYNFPASMLLIVSGLATAGLIAFIPKSAVISTTAKPPTPISGDGTNAWINKSVWIVGTVAFLLGIDWFWRWGMRHKLPQHGYFLIQLVLAELLMVLLHELGHTGAGLALGMKLRAFIVGPFQWQKREGKWKFRFNAASLFSSGGATALVPTDPRQAQWRHIWMIAAGPLVTLVSGLIALWATLTAPSQPWADAWLFLACLATLSLLVGMLNLVPFQTNQTYSDGAYLFQLLRGGPWADYHRAMSIVASSLVTSLRPRDYDIDAIQRASAWMTAGMRALLLRCYASYYYLDHGEFHKAGQALEKAESIYDESVHDMRTELHTIFIIDEAFLHRDATAARVWWDRMEAKKPTRLNFDYWLAKAALLWIEGRLDQSEEAWREASALAQQLPTAGAYQFDRYRSELLRRAMDESFALRGAENQTEAPA